MSFLDNTLNIEAVIFIVLLLVTSGLVEGTVMSTTGFGDVLLL